MNRVERPLSVCRNAVVALLLAIVASTVAPRELFAQQRGLALTVGFGIGLPVVGPMVTLRLRASNTFGVSCGVGTMILEPIGQCFAEFYQPSEGAVTRLGAAWSLRPLVLTSDGQAVRMVSYEVGFGGYRNKPTEPSTLDMALMFGVKKHDPLVRRSDWSWNADFLLEFGRVTPREPD
jgi:hypothetical protein